MSGYRVSLNRIWFAYGLVRFPKYLKYFFLKEEFIIIKLKVLTIKFIFDMIGKFTMSRVLKKNFKFINFVN